MNQKLEQEYLYKSVRSGDRWRPVFKEKLVIWVMNGVGSFTFSWARFKGQGDM